MNTMGNNMGSESRPISAIKNPAYQNNSSSAISTIGKERAIFVPSFIAQTASIGNHTFTINIIDFWLESNVSLMENTERTIKGVRIAAINK